MMAKKRKTLPNIHSAVTYSYCCILQLPGQSGAAAND